jgi:hypothetical protein
MGRFFGKAGGAGGKECSHRVIWGRDRKFFNGGLASVEAGSNGILRTHVRGNCQMLPPTLLSRLR